MASVNLVHTTSDWHRKLDSWMAGTDATIATHIKVIVDRGYVIERMEGATKHLVPSTLGIGLIEGYNDIGFQKSLGKPQLRSEVGCRTKPSPSEWLTPFGRRRSVW
jgi:DNA topoisomerase-3